MAIQKECPYPMFFNTPRDETLRQDLTQFAFEDDCSLAYLVRKVMRAYRNKRTVEVNIINSKILKNNK